MSGQRDAAKVQGALYRIAELAGAAQDMQEFYAAVHGIVGELMYAANFFIALYDEERRLISWPYYVDELDDDIPDPNKWDAFGEGDARGMTAYVLRTGEPQLLPRARQLELIAQGEIEVVGVMTEQSVWVGVPLRAEETTIGALVVQSYSAEHQYTEEDRDLLAFVGQHVGSALSRARAIEETRQRNAELALINSVQAALAGELELQAIYDVVGDKIQEVFDAQVVDIAIYDEAAGLIRFPYTIERGVRFADEPIELIGFRKHAMETREPLVIAESTPEVAERYGNPFVLSGEPVKSALFVPLVVGEPGDGRDLAPEPGPLPRVQRRRPAAPDDDRRQPQRRARQRPPRPRDPPAQRRARADQQRPGGARRRARAAGDLRHRRRQDPGGLRRPGRRHRHLRRRVRARCASRTRSSAAYAAATSPVPLNAVPRACARDSRSRS